MERIEYRDVIDKSDWNRGPWDNEPDKIQWQDEATGLPCLIVRGPAGSLCGYVGVTHEHPYFCSDYDSCDVNVHGGLTFASQCQDRPENRSVCHKPGDGEPDHVWWLGFDCAHCGDLSPGYASYWPKPNSSTEKYRDLAYVENECRELAQQLNMKKTELKSGG